MNKKAPSICSFAPASAPGQGRLRAPVRAVWDPPWTFRAAAVAGVWGWPAAADEGIPLANTLRVTASFLAPGPQPCSRRKIHFRLLRLQRLAASDFNADLSDLLQNRWRADSERGVDERGANRQRLLQGTAVKLPLWGEAWAAPRSCPARSSLLLSQSVCRGVFAPAARTCGGVRTAPGPRRPRRPHALGPHCGGPMKAGWLAKALVQLLHGCLALY